MSACFTTPNRCVKPAVEPSSCSSKNLVSSRNVKIKDDIDRISRLPDALLCDILSFLPTKEAVATSVLAKRWGHLFTWLPHLDIHDSPISDSILSSSTPRSDPIWKKKFVTFRKFVDNLLRSFKSESITKFRVRFGKTAYFTTNLSYSHLRPKHVNKWLCFPLTRGVRILDLCVFVKEPGKLPPAIFSCQTLEVLKIDTNLDLECPINVHLPNLKVLNLCSQYKCFPADDAVARLVSSCQILEHLTLNGTSWGSANPINISAPYLRRLDLFVMDAEHRSACVFDTPNLEYLNIWDSVALQYSIGDLNSLIEAHVFLDLYYFDKESVSVTISRFVRLLSNVRHLHLAAWLEELENYNVKIDWPVFQNLKRLGAKFEGCVGWHEEFMKLLDSSPHLETIVFEEVTMDLGHFAKGAYSETAERETRFWRTTGDIPYCVQTHMKKIAIKKYRGIEWELGLVEYFLSKALGLEELEITCEASMTLADRLSLETTLQNLPRASLNCSIRLPFKFSSRSYL